MRFRVYTHRLIRPVRTRFRYAYPMTVKLASECKSLTHYTKGTRSPQLQWLSIHFTRERSFAFCLAYARRAQKNPCLAIEAGAPTVCMHAVSGSISLPSRGSFRLSLTVLVRYRSITSI
jgi:hypothetical protein